MSGVQDPALLREVTSRNRVRREAVAGNPALDEDSVRVLAEDWSFSVRAAVAGRADLPADLRARLYLDDDYAVGLAFARREDLTREEAGDLFSRFGQKSIRNTLIERGLIAMDRAAGSVMEMSVWDFGRMVGEGRISEAVAIERIERDPGTATALTRKISKGEFGAEVSDGLFAALLSSEGKYVRENLAATKGLNAQRLAQVMEGSSSQVRVVLASNPGLGDAEAEAIMVGRSVKAAYALLMMTEPVDRARWAVEHANPEVRLKAAEVLPFTHPARAGLVTDPDYRVRARMVSAALDAEVLSAMCHDGDPIVRGRVANLTPNPADLRVLAEDSSAAVRARVAGRRNAGGEIIEMLSRDPAKRVRETALETFMAALT